MNPDRVSPVQQLRPLIGSAKHPDRAPVHDRLPEVTDETVEALGKLSEALEVVENARGLLYQFHRLCGTADLTLQQAVHALRQAGHPEVADAVEDMLVGRDIVPGQWSFQLVEAYDEQYWSAFRAVEQAARAELAGGVPHLLEAEMKHAEQQ